MIGYKGIISLKSILTFRDILLKTNRQMEPKIASLAELIKEKVLIEFKILQSQKKSISPSSVKENSWIYIGISPQIR